MNYDLLLLVLFYIFLLIIFRLYRNKFEVQWKVFALYKTKIGIRLMDKIAKKFPKSLNFFGYISVIIGFIGMVVTFIFILYETYKYLFIPKSEVALAPLIPGVTISDKLPALSFWHWIIAILIVAIIHEFSHGVYARLRNIKINSSGFAFLGPILAAFVEPDEKQLAKKPTKDKLFVMSAGPFSNIVLGIVVLLILAFVFVPIGSSLTQVNGLIISGVNESLPINNSGLKAGYVLEEVNGVKIDDSNVLSDFVKTQFPGDVVTVKANGSYYNITLAGHPDNNSIGFFGLTFSGFNVELKDGFKPLSWLYPVFKWLGMLLFWIFNISIGVGLFNLLPLGPVDGGRMFYAAMLNLTKNKKVALKLLSFISFIILAMILINMWPFFVRLFSFIIGLF